MSYVDGFLLPLPSDKVEMYREKAQAAGKVWMEHGALAFVECVADDMEAKECIPFTKPAGVKDGEIVVFSYIVFSSREHRDAVNAKVMEDPRVKDSCKDLPFDYRRMAYGGFKSIVNL